MRRLVKNEQNALTLSTALLHSETAVAESLILRRRLVVEEALLGLDVPVGRHAIAVALATTEALRRVRCYGQLARVAVGEGIHGKRAARVCGTRGDGEKVVPGSMIRYWCKWCLVYIPVVP